MPIEGIFTLAVVAVMLVALVGEWLEPDAIVFSALGVLLVTGVLTPQEAIGGFANKGMLTVGILFIVAYAAQSSGVLELFATLAMGRGQGYRFSLVNMMAPVVAMSAFLNNTPIVAMFTPTIREWALKAGFSPSRFLIPLSYASIFGGICTLIGTSTNLVVNGLLNRELGISLSMFELAYVGIPCAVAGMAYLVLFGHRLLPEQKDLTEGLEAGGREYLLEMRVQDNSPLVGKSVQAAGLRRLEKLFLAEVVREDEVLAPVKPGDILQADDRLIFTGLADAIVQLQKIPGLVASHDRQFYNHIRTSGKGRIIEAVVSRSSPILRKTIKDANFRGRYDAVVLAVHRNGERINAKIGTINLRAGDTLLLLAGDDFLKRWGQSREFYMISRVSDIPEVNRKKTLISIATLLGMVLLAATGILDIFQAAVLAAMILLISRCLTTVEARRSLELNVLIIIASSLGISKALDKTGAAGYLASYLIEAVKSWGPLGLLAAIYFVTSLLTEVITNNAAAAIVFPIATAAAMQAGVDPKPFAIAIAVAASASFATPIGYQTNLMVYGPGGYRYRDFLRIGIPLNLIFMAVAILVIPSIWSF